MRKATFTVPQEVILDFCDALIQKELDHKITETTEENEIIFEINYRAQETKAVDELENELDSLIEQLNDDE